MIGYGTNRVLSSLFRVSFRLLATKSSIRLPPIREKTLNMK